MEQEQNAATNAGQRPIISFSGSGNLNVAIWKNKSESGFDQYSVRLDKSYKDGDGNYKTTSYLNADDLLRAAELYRQADQWIEQDRQRQRSSLAAAR